MVYVPYGIAVIADSRNNPELSTLQSICDTVNAQLVPSTIEPTFVKINGVTIPATGKNGVPDTAEVVIFSRIVVLFTASGPTRQRMETSSPLVNARFVYWNRDLTRVEAETQIKADLKEGGATKIWILDKSYTVPPNPADWIPLFTDL